MHDFKKISATQLESFVTCPLRFKKMTEGEESCNSQAPLDIGTLFHVAMQSKELSEMMLYSVENKLNVSEIKKMKELIRHSDRFKKADAYEIRFETEVFSTTLTGTPDEIHIEENWWEDEKKILIIDNKTTTMKWDNQKYSEMFQKYLYSYLVSKNTGCKNIHFQYRVFPKKSLILDEDVQIFEEKIDIDEAEIIIKNLIAAYEESARTGFFPPVKDMHCFYCQYRENCSYGLKRKSKEERDLENGKLEVEVDF